MGILWVVLNCGFHSLSIAPEWHVQNGTAAFQVYDTVAYMSVPATVFLLPFAMLLALPTTKMVPSWLWITDGLRR